MDFRVIDIHDEELLQALQNARFPEDGTARILNALGRQFIPDGLDLDALRGALAVCCARYREVETLRTGTARQERRKFAKGMASHASALLNYVREGDRQAVLWEYFPPTDELRTPKHSGVPSLEKIIDALERLKAVGEEIQTPTADARFGYEKRDTALKLLVVEFLPPLYEHYILREPGMSRTADGQPDGPYVRFSCAVADEFGGSLTPETFATYWQRRARPLG